MNRLNEILYELGISKVKLAKYLGVSRQMIYNYLELDDINKWPKDKKVMLLNLLGIKSGDEIDSIKVDTDYIMSVEARINSLFEPNITITSNVANIPNGLGNKQKSLLNSIIQLIADDLEDEKNEDAYNTYKYLYHFLQTLSTSKELKYILAYTSKAAGFTKPLEFAFNEDEQFVLESIMFSAMTLYKNGGNSKTKMIEAHKRFVNEIENRIEEKMSRTLELNLIKERALKELGYSSINDKNAAEVFEKIAEIESRKVAS